VLHVPADARVTQPKVSAECLVENLSDQFLSDLQAPNYAVFSAFINTRDGLFVGVFGCITYFLVKKLND
jgi:hypothetical protein